MHVKSLAVLLGSWWVTSCLMFDCLAANVWLSVILMIDQMVESSMDLSEGRNHVSFEKDENEAVRNGVMNCGQEKMESIGWETLRDSSS